MPEQQRENPADSGGSPNGGAAHEGDTFLGTYKSKEEAEKGFAEKDNHIAKLQAENQFLREAAQRAMSSPATTEPAPQPEREIWEDEGFQKELDANFDKPQQALFRKAVTASTALTEKRLRSEVQELKDQRMVEQVKSEFPDTFNKPEFVKSVRDKMTVNPNLTIIEACRLVGNEPSKAELEALRKENAALKEAHKRGSFVDPGGGNVPREMPAEDQKWLDNVLPKGGTRRNRV